MYCQSQNLFKGTIVTPRKLHVQHSTIATQAGCWGVVWSQTKCCSATVKHVICLKLYGRAYQPCIKLNFWEKKSHTLLIGTNIAGRSPLHSTSFHATNCRVAGWCTRYKVIQWSMWIMWVGSMLATLSSVVAQLVDSYTSYINDKVTAAILCRVPG